MSNPDSLVPFKKGHDERRGHRTKGSLNRSTILKRFLGLRINPGKEAETLKSVFPEIKNMTAEEAMHLMQLAKAIKTGDTNAYKAVLDNVYGLLAQKIDGMQLNITSVKNELLQINDSPEHKKEILQELDMLCERADSRGKSKAS